MLSATHKNHMRKDTSFSIVRKKTLLGENTVKTNSFFLALYHPGSASRFMAETVSVTENDWMTDSGLDTTLKEVCEQRRFPPSSKSITCSRLKKTKIEADFTLAR